ncbi:MAG: CpsD/CapB family tyrosine-protein kinase, partial [Gemmatimonadetes bacterium]|nr:CpsD/CapB family tyrosine-protein kinase [Gemmatimonadota bacterium]
GVEQEPGLTHVLMGHAKLDDAIQHLSLSDEGEAMDFLASGVFPPNPAELLGSQRMRDLLAELRARYDMVVFDAAPLSLVTDAAVLGTLADATVLVARTGVTDKRALQHASAQIYQLGAPFGGVVLNDVDVERESRYYGYSYGYGLGYGYGSYGSYGSREHANTRVNGNGNGKP